VVLYEVLTGRRPFESDNLGNLYYQVLYVEPQPPSALRCDLDGDLEAICLKALAKKPADRQASMAELAAALGTYLVQHPEIIPDTVSFPPPDVELSREIVNGLGMKLVLVGPGRFLMGSPASEADRSDDEQQHEVEITRPFYLGVHAVTVGNFRTFVERTGYKTEAERSGGASRWNGSKWELDPRANWRKPGFKQGYDHPVTCVSWNDAQEFCKWLSGIEKERLYRLLTEAEWEYACRGPVSSSTPFHFGTSLSSAQANFDGNYPYGGASKGPYLERTTPVGSYPPNALGLYDMHGNVWEWCADWYGPYADTFVTDPTGPTTGERRVLRGGSWSNSGRSCRAAYRFNDEPGYRSDYLGFRVVCATARTS
jgi:formylglycine-generating enzyme required for sulfatase activity